MSLIARLLELLGLKLCTIMLGIERPDHEYVSTEPLMQLETF